MSTTASSDPEDPMRPDRIRALWGIAHPGATADGLMAIAAAFREVAEASTRLAYEIAEPRKVMEPGEYMTPGDLSDWLRVSEESIRKWVKEGILPEPLHIGKRHILYHQPTVRQYLDRANPRTEIEIEEFST